MSTNDGGPAFPFIYECPKTGPNVYSGMSLRDYFAGQALGGTDIADFREPIDAAAWAYGIADAMLAAREAKP